MTAGVRPSLPMDRLTNGWLPFKTIAIPSNPMVVSPKSLTIPSPKSFHHRSGLIWKYSTQWALGTLCYDTGGMGWDERTDHTPLDCYSCKSSRQPVFFSTCAPYHFKQLQVLLLSAWLGSALCFPQAAHVSPQVVMMIMIMMINDKWYLFVIHGQW